MTDTLTLLFSQQFLIRALVVGILISLCTSLLGVSLVLKRFSMIGDGLSHVSFGTMAIATAAGIAPLYFSLPIVIIAAFMLLRLNESAKIKGDAAIALISTGALAVGVMATSMTTGMNIDIYNYMFGSILTMDNSDTVVTCIVSVVVITLFTVFYHEIFCVTFDESFAKATGTRVSLYNMLIAALTAVTIVIGMRMMGALLISSLLIFPTVTSMRLCKSYKKVVVCSVFISVFCFISGLVLSIKFEAPTGASVVIVNILMLLLFSLLQVIQRITVKSKFFAIKRLLTLTVILLSSSTFIFALFSGDFTQYKNEKISIVATAFAQYDFARQIVGEHADVIMLLSPGEESHTYEPTPEDILKIRECDVFIYGGGESDAWIDTVLDSVDEDIRTVKMMSAVDVIENVIHDDGHAHEHEHEHEYDEHVWTSPHNAVLISQAICDAVCEVDNVHADYYKKNTAEYILMLEQLDSDFIKLTEHKKHNYIIVGDRFPLRYFTQRYNIGYYSAFPGCSAQAEANPVTVSDLCNRVKRDDISVVFKVDMSKGEIAKTISAETGAAIETLYSCHTVSLDDLNNGETYISLMMRNYNALKKALY